MDKDLLRIVIIITGILVMAGMILWSNLGNRKSRHKINLRDDKDPLGNVDESLIIRTEDDDFEITPLGSAVEEEIFVEEQVILGDDKNAPIIDDSFPPAEDVEKYFTSESLPEVPALIQFSVVASGSGEFNGVQLIPVLELVGLTFASTQVFERLDENKLVEFTIASMVEPGTFPLEDPESFVCPGLAFFMQPKELDNPIDVFDDFIAVLHQVSGLLGGVEWDASREPLTEETIQLYRRILSAN